MRVPNIMVVATDAGGGAVTAPVAALAREQGWQVTVFSGRCTADFFHDYNLNPLCAVDDLSTQMRCISPDVILLGTTRYPSPERSITKLARPMRIPSVAILDDWSNYLERFSDGPSKYVLPDLICCPDKLAKQEMLDEGISEDRLMITGHPALAIVAEKIKKRSASPPPRPNFFPTDGTPVMVFLSETHSLDFGVCEGQSGPLGPYLGYTEFSVRQELANLTSSIFIVEKLHPSDTRTFSLPTDCVPGRWINSPKYPLWELLWHADIVVGMKSVALLESALLGRPTVSYQPNLIGPDPCSASRTKVVTRMEDLGMLTAWAHEALNTEKSSLVEPEFSNLSASEQVLKALIRVTGRG